MPTHNKTELQRDYDLAESCTELIVEVLDAEHARETVAISAIINAIHAIVWRGSANAAQFIGRSGAILIALSDSEDRFMTDKLNDWIESLPDHKKPETLIKILHSGPESVKIKDGKIIGVE